MLESLDNGKPFSVARSVDVPMVILSLLWAALPCSRAHTTAGHESHVLWCSP